MPQVPSPFYPPHQAARTRPARRGSAAGSKGAPVYAAPTFPAPFYPPHAAIRGRMAPPRRGAALGSQGAPVVPPAQPFPAYLLGLYVQLLLNGTWTDISSYVQYAPGIKITRGRPDETQEITPAQCTLRLLNPDGRFSPNTAGAYYPNFGRNTLLRVWVSTWSAAGVPVSGYRFWGQCASLSPGWDQSGNYRYVDVTAAGPLRRYSQGNATIGSAIRRYYTTGVAGTSKAPYGYWPTEDAQGATEFASYVAGVPPMGFTGSPQLGSDSDFGGSDSIPSVNSSSWHGQTGADSNPPGTGSITQITPGTYTWTCPPGVTEVTDVASIAGGGGGGCYGPTAGGGGGGGGGQSLASSIGVSEGVTYTYVVGAGGQAGGSLSAPGTAGGASSWTGDTQACTAGGGGGGDGGDTATGGDGGTGTHAGGAGAQGQADITTSGSQTLSGVAGATGTASGGTAGQTSVSWTAVTTTALVTAAGAAGGGQGGGAYGEGYGGGGGGGGGKASGTIDTTPGSSYTFYAGLGGSGGKSGTAGETGGVSSVSGDNGTSVLSNAGEGGSGAGSGGSGGGTTGSPGGDGARAETGEGMGGGGGGGGGAGANGDGQDAGGGSSGATQRPPGGGGGDGSGGGWGAVSNGGTGSSAGGTGSNGTPGSRAPGGGGGGGAITNSSGQGGGGGGGGWITWSWSVTGPAGGGGGSSGGTSSAGNAGNINGTGGTEVTGGGAGGDQGSPGTAPGGGGGGGIPAGSSSTTPVAAGNGAPGQVSFAWSGGSISPVAADIVRFLLDVQSAGGTQPSFSFTCTGGLFTAVGTAYANGTPVQLTGSSLPSGTSADTTYYVILADSDSFELAASPGGSSVTNGSGSGSVATTAGWVVARILTYGTVARMDVVYNSAGTLELIGYSSGGSVLFDSGAQPFGLNGTPVMADVELTASGGNATWSLSAIEPGADSAIAAYTGTVDDVTVGYVSDWYCSPNSDVDFASVGHPAVQTYADPLTTLAQVIAGYAGELAEARLARLCAEEGLSFTLLGPSGVTPAMQAQQDDTFTNVIQSCEDCDRGLLFEDRNSFGLVYASRISLQGQSPAVTLDYSLADMASPLSPVADDQYTRNDIQLSRNNGSSALVMQETGLMSIQPPPAGVGDYLYTLTVYLNEDSQLANCASWMLTVGTVPDERFPVISVDMSRTEITQLFGLIASLDMGAYLQVINPPSWLTGTPIQQLAWGVTETLNQKMWRIDYNAVPESPYSVGNPPTW